MSGQGRSVPPDISGLATIGYQGATIAAFVRTLVEAEVDHLIDVRAVPLSRKPGFSKRQLAAELEMAGLRYSSLRGLGTPRAGRDAARRGDVATMRAIFARQLETAEAARDLDVARAIAGGSAACLVCFERDPHSCHRLAVAEAMGGPVRHLYCEILGQCGHPLATGRPASGSASRRVSAGRRSP